MTNKPLEKIEEQEEEVVEMTAETEATEIENLEEKTAAETLKPNSMPASDSMSKVEMMKSVIGAMGAMEKSDLVSFFDSVQSQYGANKDWGVGDKSGQNAASIESKNGAGPKTADPMPKISVKEDVEHLFDGEDLSEELKERVTTIFEAAISAKISVETARLEEEFETKLAEQTTALEEKLIEGIDAYMTEAADEWMKDNEVAIESALRNEVMEEFIESLKKAFTDHYIDIPEEKVDVIEQLSSKISDLESDMDKIVKENAELKGTVLESKKEEIFTTVSSDLALTQIEKFRALAEGVDFSEDLDVYAKKLAIIKDKYFNEEKKSTTTVVSEEFEAPEEQPVYMDETIKKYADAISKSIRK